MPNLVTVHNIIDLDFSSLVDLLHDIYTKEIPEISLTQQANPAETQKLMIFFSNQYAYIVELWGTMLYHVRTLKRMGADKEGVDDAMGKRDFLEKVMSACKLKYYATSRLLYFSKGEGE